MNLPLDLLMFGALIAGILLGYPASFTIAGVATLFALIGWILGVFDLGLLGALGQRVFGLMTNNVLIAIPLFVFMGTVLEKSHIAEELLETMGKLFGARKAGLGISVIIVGALLAASTGIVGATVVAMGLIALPAMLRNNYDPKLSCGIVCSAGTLGQIIPPSTLLIILADVMSNSFQQAQFSQGKFSIETISVGQIFAAAFIPGLLLVGIYIGYLLIYARLYPNSAPSISTRDQSVSMRAVFSAIIPPVLLIVAVLGSILGGIATPSEAASIGAVGALLMAGFKLGAPKRIIILGAACLLALAVIAGTVPVRMQRSDTDFKDVFLGGVYLLLVLITLYTLFLSLKQTLITGKIKQVLTSTLTITSMIFATIISASIFSLVFIGLNGDVRIEQILQAMPGGANGALIFSMAIIFVLGFFMDFVEIAVIVLPLVVPALILMGHDPIWLAILVSINLQTSFLTPPFGFSLFYLRGAAPREITTGQIYQGVMPFIFLHIFAVMLLWVFPAIITWLPGQIY